MSIACELALEANVLSSDYVLNALSRLKPQVRIEPIATPEGLKLATEPQADTARYDQLLNPPGGESDCCARGPSGAGGGIHGGALCKRMRYHYSNNIAELYK